MPLRKKQRCESIKINPSLTQSEQSAEKLLCQLVNENGIPAGSDILLPITATPNQLQELLITFLKESNQNEAEFLVPYSFFIDDCPLQGSIKDLLHAAQKKKYIEKQLSEGRRVPAHQDLSSILPFEVPEEQIISIVYKPQSIFRVKSITRCQSSLSGHSEAVLVVCFSPDSSVLATGGGDASVRIWDIFTQTTITVLKGHTSWVQVLAWSPNGKCLTSGSRDGTLVIWTHEGDYTKFSPRKHKGHNNYLSHISWEPLHRNPLCHRFVSASKDTTLKVWHVTRGLEFSLTGHQSCVTCVKWGGENQIFSSSQDRTVMVWDAINGKPLQVLKGHAHWVNFLALNTDLVIRTGIYDGKKHNTVLTPEESQNFALERYTNVLKRGGHAERLVTCSDDNTMMLWIPKDSHRPIAHLTGHQEAIYFIQFSPDGSMIASSSADKSIRLWNALDGKFMKAFRGHVGPVYQVSWSLDSRMLVSGSRDSTVKLWSVEEGDMVENLSGHLDEIFAIDWSPNGQQVATGSKDKTVRIWTH